MYTGTNPSALRSREWIHDALLQLLEQRKYNQITIKDICKKADLSRQTFYQIFDSREEVMEYHFSLLFQQFMERCDAFRNITRYEVTYRFFEGFYLHRDFVQILIDNNMIYLLEQQFEKYLQQIAPFRKFSQRGEHGDYVTAFMAGALTRMLVHWFRRDCDLSIPELCRITESIISGRALPPDSADAT